MKNYRSIRSGFILISIIIGFSTQSVHAQHGIPYMTFLDSREGYEVNNWAVCQDDHHAMLFASRKGLLRFDGSTWQQVAVPHIPHVIKQNPFNHKVYIISERDYGYLERNEKGTQYYVPLTMEGELSGPLTDILFSDTCIMFYGENSISCHGSRDHQMLFRHTRGASGIFSGLFSVNEQTFVTVKGQGLHVMTEDSLISSGISRWNTNEGILFFLPHEEEQVLLGTYSGELLLFNGENSKEFKLSNPEYLVENGLSGGLILNDTIYAFSTDYGGVLLADRRTGKIIYTLNYESGLPDDEIYAMGKDQNNGLWLTYGFGTCRVDMNLKVKDFSHYPGIEGLYTNAFWYQGELYVASTEGLFYLAEVKNYEEVEIYLKQVEKQVVEQAEKERTTRKRLRKENVEESREKKNLFSRIFNRNKRDPAENTREEKSLAQKSERKTGPSSPRVNYVRKKVSKLKSIEHVFKKAEGLNSRCEQLLATNNGLLVGSSSGLYLVSGHEVTSLSNIKNIEYISKKNKDGQHYILCEDGVFSLDFEEDAHRVMPLPYSFDEQLFSIVPIDSSLWVSGYDVVYRIQQEGADSVSTQAYPFQSVFPEELNLDLIDGVLYLFSESSIRYYSQGVDSFLVYHSDKEVLNTYSNLTFFPPVAGQHWVKLDQGMVRFDGDASQFQEEKWGLFENISTFYSHTGSEYWIIDDYSKIFRIDAEFSQDTSTVFEIFLEAVQNESGESVDLSSLEFNPNEKMVSIQVSAPSFLRSHTTVYQYKVEEKMERWSAWAPNSTLDILLDPGKYTILVRAKNLVGHMSQPITVALSVRKPFYQTTGFYIGLIPFVLGLLYLLVYMRERKLRRDKRVLEFKVEERTKEIQKQKQKIEIQKDEILAQKDDITSSITYASRIQKAILPSKQLFEKTFSDYFVYYQPRDIVSGDFYWVTEKKGEIIFAVADCTGHGVPGAFMSMLGNSFLNEITKEAGVMPANQILNRLRDMVNEALTQSGENIKANDGMDISLCRYNIKKKEIEYSGAYNSLYHLRKGVFTEYKADRMPIGFYPKKKNFSAHSIKMEKDDVIYLFSDGFQDQFGGPYSKKYTSKQFKQILTALSPKKMDDQLKRLEIELEAWRGNSEQVDDILIIGIRI